MKKFILLILDGFGLREESEGNAHKLAQTPHLDRLLATEPTIPLKTSGLAVGLPKGVMGNSEVGHMNMGAGRVVQQDLVRINHSIDDGSFTQNAVLRDHMLRTIKRGGTYHLIGLTSNGGVHSHVDHIAPVLKLAQEVGLERIAYHAILDGRDTSPRSGKQFLAQVEATFDDLKIGTVATVSGRYYIMDRDHRWDRIERAYRTIAGGEGKQFDSASDAIDASYDADIGDEFFNPVVIDRELTLSHNDSILGLNFRADRMRQLIRVLTDSNFSEFSRADLDLDIVSMTSYEESFDFPVLFEPVALTNIFPEELSRAGYRQLRVAETEKYAHVTYFFNGGREVPFENEARNLVPSPKVATYDLQPEMSALKVTDIAVDAFSLGEADAIIMNLANPDMVGHTGIIPAGISAMEVIDTCVGRLVDVADKVGATIFITADHGNIEMMINPETGEPHTAHTTLDVPFIMAGKRSGNQLTGAGSLADIAPTIMEHIGLPIPADMDGVSRLQRPK